MKDVDFIKYLFKQALLSMGAKTVEEQISLSDSVIVSFLEWEKERNTIQWKTFREEKPNTDRLIMVNLYGDDIDVFRVDGTTLVTLDEINEVVTDLDTTPTTLFGTDVSDRKWAYIPEKI